MDRSDLAIVIPAYSEATTIAGVVEAASQHATVLVVDDCSPDDTAALAASAGAIVIRNSQNCGYDGTLNRGFEEAAKRGFLAVVTLDADGEHSPDCIPLFQEALIDQDVPLVIGVRPGKQRLSEVVMGAIVMWRYGVKDILCGMKGYHLSLWEQNGGFDKSGSIGTELAIHSLRRGVRFRQIPVYGVRRQDAPRFGSSLRANIKIVKALLRVLTKRSAL